MCLSIKSKLSISMNVPIVYNGLTCYKSRSLAIPLWHILENGNTEIFKNL